MKTLHRKLLIAQKAALVFLIGGRALNGWGRFVRGRTLPLGIVVVAAGALLVLAACLDIASQPFGPHEVPGQPEFSGWIQHPEESEEERIARQAALQAEWESELRLWRRSLREAEQELADVLQRYPDDARRIEDAELAVRNSRDFVEIFEMFTTPPWEYEPLVEGTTAADDDSFCIEEPVIEMTTGPQLQVTQTGGRVPRVRASAIGSHRTSEDQKHQVAVIIKSRFATSGTGRRSGG